MSLYNYTFMGEIEDYNIEDYTPFMPEIGSLVKDFKIYKLSGSSFLFLHNEGANKLYQFYAIDPAKLNSREAYENVIRAYNLVDF